MTNSDPAPTRRFRLIPMIAKVLLALFSFGFVFGTVLTPPNNASVWVNDTQKQFVPPPFRDNNPSIAPALSRLATYGDVRALGYRAEPNCNKQSCWAQDGRSLSGKLLQAAGLLRPVRMRWNADGTWNW